MLLISGKLESGLSFNSFQFKENFESFTGGRIYGLL